MKVSRVSWSTKVLRTLFALASLGVVLWIALWESQQLISPGELHPSHADVAQLQGGSGCVVCHGEAERSMTEACNACHKMIKEQMEQSRGLHGGLNTELATACEKCHREHAGKALPLVSGLSFRIADIDHPDQYDHHHVTDFNLTGRHNELACQDCHQLANAAALQAGQRRFLGLSSDCMSCHEDPHEGSYGLNCANCHDQQFPFEQATAFEHDPLFPLRGGHAQLACKACHEKGTPYSIATLRSRPYDFRQCTDCHRAPHWPSFLRGVAAISDLTETENDTCTLCHEAEHETFLGPQATVSASLHQATGFTLDPPHDQQECKQCHEQYGKRKPLPNTDQLASRFAILFPGRSEKNCQACHDDPHEDQFDTGATQGLCLACHEATRFSPSKFDIVRHADTQFHLTGSHQTIDCNACHVLEGELRRFVPTATACADCHEDVHHSQFDSGATGGSCTACHDTTHFSPSQFDIAQHDHTPFQLTGSHQAVACNKCHLIEGQLRRFVPTATACADCHEDVHEGIFDGPDKPRSIAGRLGCARCHETTSFADIRLSNEEHGRWTGYSLDGAHANAVCTDCHKPNKQPDRHGRIFGKTDRSCASCHRDPHAGQFRLDQEDHTRCERCHLDTTDFSEILFNHQLDSRFPLDEHHSTLDCAACHKPATTTGSERVIRFRPLGTQCQDCHDSRRLKDFEEQGSEER